MNWLRRFMYGRYGIDHLGRFLLVLALILYLSAFISGIKVIYLLYYVPIIIAVLRILSKNITKRSHENMVYLRITDGLKKWLKNRKLLLIGTKTHCYFRCKQCRQIIRVPRGKGKLSITCPKCRKEFIKRT